MTLNIKTACVIIGLVLTVVGLAINNWKVAVVGNSIAVFGGLFA